MEAENRFAELRKQAGLSQQALAEQIYVTRQSVSSWEKGETLPSVENLVCLSKLYGVSVDYLLHGDAAQEPQAQTEKAPAAVEPEKAPVAVAVEEAPKTPARRMRRWQKIALAACAVVVLVLLALYIFRPARSTDKVIPLEDIPGEVVDTEAAKTFPLD